MFRTLLADNDVVIITPGNCIWGCFEKHRFDISSAHVVNTKISSCVVIRRPAAVSRTYLISGLYPFFLKRKLLLPSSVNWGGSN